MTLAEMDRNDPSETYLGLYVETPYSDQPVHLEGNLTVGQLDTMIQVLTLARDIAICEGMIEPSAG